MKEGVLFYGTTYSAKCWELNLTHFLPPAKHNVDKCDSRPSLRDCIHLDLGPKNSVPAHLYSHSMVPGGLDVQSSTTRLTSGTPLVMRVEMRASTS